MLRAKISAVFYLMVIRTEQGIEPFLLPPAGVLPLHYYSYHPAYFFQQVIAIPAAVDLPVLQHHWFAKRINVLV